MVYKTGEGVVFFNKVGFLPLVISADKIIGKKVREIRKEIAPDFEILAIRYGTYQERLDDDIILTDKYPKIVLPPETNKLKKQEYSLLPLTTIDKDAKWIIAGVMCQEKYKIPNFYVKIDDLSNRTAQDFIEKAFVALDMETIPIGLEYDGKEIELDMGLDKLFGISKEKRIYYKCTLTDKSISLYKKRIHITNEIRTTEETYVNQLFTINNFWCPNLIKMNVFDESETKMITGDFPAIFNIHKAFYEALCDLSDNYSTQVSCIFVARSPFFLVAGNYISHFPQVQEIIETKNKIRSTKKELLNLAEKQDRKDVISFLVTPVQRIPKYQLFLRDLMMCTPSSHPDATLLKAAVSAVEKILRKLDEQSKIVKQMQDLSLIESTLLNKFTITKKGRIIVHQSKVTIDGSSNAKGVLYIFNDIVLGLKVQPKSASVLFDFPTEAFHFRTCDDSSIEVTAIYKPYMQTVLNIWKDSVKYKLTFKNKEEKKEFMAELKKAQDSIVKNQQLYIEWVPFDEISLPCTCKNAGCANGTEFFFFGGEKVIQSEKSTQNVESSTLIAVNQFTHNSDEIDSLTSGCFGHTMTIVGSRIFIIGGRNRQKFFKNILSYNLKTDVWYKIIPNSEEHFIPRYGHTSVVIDSKIIIFGGKTPRGEILNTLTVFDPFDNVFQTINVNVCPQARYYHSAAVIGHSMYIYGGKTGKSGKYLSDFWEFNTDTLMWENINIDGFQLGPRACHTMFNIRNSLMIVGGETPNEKSAPSALISTNNFTCKEVMNVGNVPKAIRKFASFVDRRCNIYIYGGLERPSNDPVSFFYKLIPNDNLYVDLMSQNENNRNVESKQKWFKTQKVVRIQIPSRALYSDKDDDFEKLRFGITSDVDYIDEDDENVNNEEEEQKEEIEQIKEEEEEQKEEIEQIKEEQKEQKEEIKEIKEEEKQEVKPIKTEQKKEIKHIKEEEKQEVKPIKEEEKKEIKPIKEEVKPVKEEKKEVKEIKKIEPVKEEEKQEQILMEEIPVLKDVISIAPPVASIRKKTVQAKKEVSVAKPLNEVIKKLKKIKGKEPEKPPKLKTFKHKKPVKAKAADKTKTTKTTKKRRKSL